MITINLKFTGEKKVYHDYFKPLILSPNIDLPKMYNQGLNSFRFIGGEPIFLSDNMPEENKRETTNFIFFESSIQVINSDGKTTSGNYYKSINKNTKEIKETFCFD